MSVPAVSYPIRVKAVPVAWRGDKFSIELSLRDTAGALVDPALFGTTWTAMARRHTTSATKIDFTVVASSITKTVKITLTGAQTALIPPADAVATLASYGYDVQATGGGTSPITVWTGRFDVDGDYTRV